MKKLLASILLCAGAGCVSAQTNTVGFEENFRDSTLRIDYVFSGNADTQHISLDKLNVMPHWYGCLLYTSPSPRDLSTSRMPSSA